MKVTDIFKKVGSYIRLHAPDIMMGVGTAGVIGGTVILCHETTKLPEILDDYREQKADILDSEELTAEDKKELRNLKLKTAGKVALNYLPGAALEGSGLVSMWTGYGKMKTWFVGAAWAYNGLKAVNDKLRQQVRDEFGEETDDRLTYGWHEETVTTTDEDGNEKTETVKVYPRDIDKMPSIYARYFCYGESEAAEHSIEYNKFFLEGQEETITRRFWARGYYYLNDLYDDLGYKRTKAGGRVGWVYDKNKPVGDNKIELRVREVCREKFDDFGNPDGWETVLMIDPNVDGMIEDRMLEKGLIDE